LKKYFKIVYHEIKRRANVKKIVYNLILLAVTSIVTTSVFPWWWLWW